MEKNDRLDCLTEKQRTAYGLWKSGMKKSEIARQMNISYKGALQHINNAERRLRQYDHAQATREENKQPIELPLTRADGLILFDALSDYLRNMESGTHKNINSDWTGRLPYEFRIAADLFDRVQFAVFGEKVRITSLDWEQLSNTGE